jgi:hypothetical protein
MGLAVSREGFNVVNNAGSPQGGDATLTHHNIRPVEGQRRTFTAMMEQLQEGYVGSVAASAGCMMEPIPKDTYGFDIRLVRPGRTPLDEEVTLNVQLKNTTTTRPDPNQETFSYQLRKREYLERLAAPRKYVKAVLLVMVTSPNQAEWAVADHAAMTTQHCCYWECLEGHLVDPGVAAPTVRIRTKNIFDGPALTRIMDKLSRGEPLI